MPTDCRTCGLRVDEEARFCPQCGGPVGKPLPSAAPFGLRLVAAFLLGVGALVFGGAGTCFAIFAPQMGNGAGALGWFAIAGILFGLGWLCVYGIRRLFRK